MGGGCGAQAKKRQLIEQRLQDKLRKETDSVRRAEEAKKDKTTANRKEEELQLKDSIVRLLHAAVLASAWLCLPFPVSSPSRRPVSVRPGLESLLAKRPAVLAMVMPTTKPRLRTIWQTGLPPLVVLGLAHLLS